MINLATNVLLKYIEKKMDCSTTHDGIECPWISVHPELKSYITYVDLQDYFDKNLFGHYKLETLIPTHNS